jgi:hypothetical protein
VYQISSATALDLLIKTVSAIDGFGFYLKSLTHKELKLKQLHFYNYTQSI